MTDDQIEKDGQIEGRVFLVREGIDHQAEQAALIVRAVAYGFLAGFYRARTLARDRVQIEDDALIFRDRGQADDELPQADAEPY